MAATVRKKLSRAGLCSRAMRRGLELMKRWSKCVAEHQDFTSRMDWDPSHRLAVQRVRSLTLIHITPLEFRRLRPEHCLIRSNTRGGIMIQRRDCVIIGPDTMIPLPAASSAKTH